VQRDTAPVAASGGLSGRLRTLLPLLGVAGLVLWGLTTSFTTDAPPLRHGDREARVAARELLAARGAALGDDWRELATVQAPLGLEDRFVWTEGGPEAYHKLLGVYLPTPRRTVRYARFEGDVAERAEEYVVFVGPDGEAQRMTHTLPEGRAGAQLDEDRARAIALATVTSQYGLAADAIEEVSADPSQLPERRDWSFVFKVPGGYPLAIGDARIIVKIAGDEVVETGRFVHIPEDWERDYRNRRGLTQVVQIACVVLLVLIFIAGAVLAVVRWSRGRFDRATFVVFSLVAAALGAVQLAIGFRAISAQFVTAQPWKLQMAIVIVGGLIATAAVAAVTALLIGLAHRWLPPQPQAARSPSLAAGLGLGAAVAGLATAAQSLVPSKLPDWPSLAGAADTFPTLGAALAPIDSWLTATALTLFVVAGVEAVTGGWRQRKPVGAALLVAIGLVVAGSSGVESVPVWLAEGLATGLVMLVVWWSVVRRQPALVPLVTAGGAILAALRAAAVGAFPGAVAGSAIGAVAVLGFAVWWFGRISADAASTSDGRDAPAAGDPPPALEV
jgi:succinate dehydrogenase hydrophobic anchor subunit